MNEICPRLYKDGTRTAHVGRKWLGRYGKTSNGIVTVATVRVVGTPTGPAATARGMGRRTRNRKGDAACVREIGLLGQRNGAALSAGLHEAPTGDHDGSRPSWLRMLGAMTRTTLSSSGAPRRPITAAVQGIWCRRWKEAASTPNRMAPTRKNST